MMCETVGSAISELDGREEYLGWYNWGRKVLRCSRRLPKKKQQRIGIICRLLWYSNLTEREKNILCRITANCSVPGRIERTSGCHNMQEAVGGGGFGCAT